MNWFFNPQSFLIRNSMQMHSKLVFRILLKEFLGGLEFPGNWMTTIMLWKQVVNCSCTFIRVENLSIWAFVLTTLEPVNQKLDHPFLEIIEVSNSTSSNKFFLNELIDQIDDLIFKLSSPLFLWIYVFWAFLGL